MAGALRRLAENLFVFDDSCQVYALRYGREAVLIDFGSGAILDVLDEVGIERAVAVLVTHHHRDQAQGLGRAVAKGAEVWVPYQEQDLFHSVDEHWQVREVLNSYNNRQDRFSLLASVPVTGVLKDYATYSFANHQITVWPTPGHTPGSISLLVRQGELSLAFTGDLIAAPGKVWSLAATQWSYNGAEGVAATVASLLGLEGQDPDMLLPSHGAPMAEPRKAMAALTERLWSLLQARGDNPRLFELQSEPYAELTPHLLWNRTSTAYGYVLLSRTGKALLIDYGYDFMTGMAAGSDRAARRPWLYTLPMLKRSYGVTRVDVVIPTHYHDDHVAGFNLLRAREGTQIWAPENFAAILERPTRYDLPCLWYDPVKVDKTLPLSSETAWEEYTFTLHALPGHTAHAVALYLEVDGARVLAVGDQYQSGAAAKWNYVYNNGFGKSDYAKSAALFRTLQPDLILSGHWEPYWVEKGYLENLEEKGELLAVLHDALLLEGAASTGGKDRLAKLEPYQSFLSVGERVEVQATLVNPHAQSVTATLALTLPEGWVSSPPETVMVLQPETSGTARFQVLAGSPRRRARLGLDVTLGDNYLGQVAEALVSVSDERGGGHVA